MSSDHIAAVGGIVPVMTGPIVEENTRTGFESTYTFTGTYIECFNKRLALRASGNFSHLTMHPVGDSTWKVTAAAPYDEFGLTPGPVPSINELEVEIAQVELAFSKKLNLLLSSKTIAAVLLICEDFKSGKYAKYSDGDTGYLIDSGFGNGTGTDPYHDALFAVKQAAILYGESSGGQSTAQKLFTNVVGRGLAAALEYRTVYMRTLTAATPNQVRAAYTGVGMIWTPDEVSNFEGISPFDWFQLPNNPSDPVLFIKSPPKVTATARQKTQLFYSYTECKQATALLYDAYGAAVLLDA